MLKQCQFSIKFPSVYNMSIFGICIPTEHACQYACKNFKNNGEFTKMVKLL
jgi:hypothetical protein